MQEKGAGETGFLYALNIFYFYQARIAGFSACVAARDDDFVPFLEMKLALGDLFCRIEEHVGGAEAFAHGGYNAP